MNNNDIFRRIRYIFDLNEAGIVSIFGSSETIVTKIQVNGWLKKVDDPDLETIYDEELASFLNGLINTKRGKKEGAQIPPEKKINNNIIFRKIKIALSLKDVDILDIFKIAGLRVGKHELSAIFRSPNQSQYRPCKDQFLRNFLRGLQLKIRKT